MELRLLGPVEAYAAGRSIALGPRKQRAVLAMLGLQVGRTVSIDHLTEGLWGEQSPASAPKMIQLYVSQLRRLLPRDGAEIVTRGRGYELRLDGDGVDAVEFERLVEQSRGREALALWRGEPLADLVDEPFARAEIRRLEELRLRGVEMAIDEDLEAGRHGRVIGELDALIAEHPLRERLRAQRMLALYRAGRQAEALETYRDARAVLVEEIGVEPGAELQRLHEAILDHDPSLDLPTAPPRPAPPSTAAAPRPAPPVRRVPVPAIAALLLIAGVLAFGVIRVLQPDSLPGIDEDSVGLIELDSGRIVAQYAVGQGPAAVVAGGGAVWVANQLDGTVSRIDRAGEQVVTIDVGGEPTGLAYGSGSLWVADGEGRAVAQVDPRSNRVVQRIVVGNAAHAVAVGYGAVWVASAVDATVVRIDLRSGRAGAPIPVQARPSAIAAGAGSIWVASDASARVLRLDPRSGTPLTGIHVGNGPAALSVGAGAVWVANRTDGTVTRIDPASEVTESVGVGPDPQAVAAGPDGVWVAVSGTRRVVRLDPRSNDVTTAIGVGSSPAALALDEGTLWTAGQAPASAHRGGTLRVSHSGGQHLDPHSFDPLATLVYDGLVSYRRAGGVAGGTLVPDLTRELPDPAPDGRSYTFRLRPGIRFSDGRPLRVDDVRASIERFLVVTAGMGGASGYLPIRGAAGCTPAHCDLSRGIEIDAETASVTIHLSARDPEFLHKLSNALVVPAGTPRRLATTRLPAGTGPYRAQSWDPKRGGVLVRNPRFRVWTPDRPDGFPDRIVVGFQPLRAALAAVDRGETDVASLDLTVPGDGLATRYGARLHADPIAQLFYVFLNVDTPPFDDVRVRRAVNYAADRGRVARLLGSAALQQPTCQMLPPGFEGYTPSCPFTVNPSSAGVWTAPDLERARRLVAESGTRGMRVEFWTSPPFEPVGRYFASLLRRLGYRSRVRTLDDLHLILDDASASRPQLGIWAWVADSTGPFNFLKPLVSCGGDVNLSRFCDPRIDVAMRRAAGTGGPDAIERWRRVEEQLAAQAPTVPLTNAKHAVVTGERVGNYQQTALQGPLLDQLWVR